MILTSTSLSSAEAEWWVRMGFGSEKEEACRRQSTCRTENTASGWRRSLRTQRYRGVGEVRGELREMGESLRMLGIPGNATNFLGAATAGKKGETL